MRTPCWLNQLSSQAWRDIRRVHFPTTTVNTWRHDEHKTLSSGSRTPRETGERTLVGWHTWKSSIEICLRFQTFQYNRNKTFYSGYIGSSEDFPPNACVFTGVWSDAMRTALTPATWVPTCRTRRPRSLCPGWRPAEAEESEGQPEHPNHAPTHTDSSAICYMVQPVPVFSWSCN